MDRVIEAGKSFLEAIIFGGILVGGIVGFLILFGVASIA